MTYTGEIELARMWLVNFNDPDPTPLVGGTAGVAEEFAIDGEFRQYVGNVTKLVTKTSTMHQISLTFQALTIADKARLIRWTGSTLLLRTTDGLRLWGGYLGLPTIARVLRTSNADGVLYHAQNVIFTGITHDESV